MDITRDDIENALNEACNGRTKRWDVRSVHRHWERTINAMLSVVEHKSWNKHLRYRQLTKVNNNGKVRYINSPSLITLAFQHLAISKILPSYSKVDPNVGLNCKKGHGITARVKKYSVVKKLKHIYYDRRDFNFAVKIDQRKCYDHIQRKQLRKALKVLTDDKELRDAIVDFTFFGKIFPIGTPTSPLMHHIIMLSFDKWLIKNAPMAVRYADDVFIPFATKEEASQMMWRVKNFWWYTYGLRAKSLTQSVLSLDLPVDFCGYKLHRNKNKSICSHDKGYVTLRKSTYKAILNCKTDRSYASYFGLMKSADMFNIMRYVEKKMNLKELTSKVKITRKLDAQPIAYYDLAQTKEPFTIYDYEKKFDKDGKCNWIKCLIGIREKDSEGNYTGRELAKEFHGNLQYIIAFHEACEKEFGKESMLPMTEMVIMNSCGYIYGGSTNMLNYIEK